MNIKKSFRLIFRNKTYSILNIAGLAIGIAASALILLWVDYQMNPNRSVPKRENLHRIAQNQFYGDDIRTLFVCSSGLFDAINDNLAGVKRSSRYSDETLSFRIDKDHTSFGEYGLYADSSLFAMIDLPFVAGNPQTAFTPAYPVVVSQKMAEKIFGNKDPLGKTLYVNDQIYEVTGVFKDREENGTFRFDWLIPIRILENDYISKGWLQRGGWGNWMYCYVETEPHADINSINQYLTTVLRERSGWGDRNEIFIYPIQRLRLYSEFKDGKPTGSGYIRTVRMFFVIGMAILLIACINFMNMNTARSQKRALEVGMRKTFGAKYLQLIGQFMGESALVTFISLAVGVVLVLYALPLFNYLFSLHLAVDITNPYHSIGLLAVGLLCTLLSGIYPAFYMSSFSPIHTLKKMKTNVAGSAGLVRKGLVVFQFAISYVLICSTAIIYLQIRHVQNRSLGMELKHLMMFQAPDELERNFAAVQEALINTGVVTHAGLSSQQMINLWYNSGGYNWQGKAPDVNPLVSHVNISPGLIETTGIKFSEGVDFTWQYFGEKPEVIINRSFADLMGEEGRVGGFVEKGEFTAQIIGIVEDFVFNNYTKEKAEPVILLPNTSDAERLFVRLKQGVRESEATGIIRETLQQFVPGASFEPSYMDEMFDRRFNDQRFTGKLAGLFAALAVFLSCMGVFGLSAYAAEQRTKEIGIRKVLGASVWDIVYLLGRNFMQLFLIALVIGLPAAWYAGRMYLQGIEYRISLQWYIFVGAALLVFLIAMLTVSAQALKAATANPVNAIKSE